MKRLAMPNPADIARSLRALLSTLPPPGGRWVEPGPDDDDNDDDGGTDVRLQVYPSGEWAIRSGDSSYDQDHTGYWGASYLTHDAGDCEELARELADEAGESAAQSGREVIDYGAAGWDEANDDDDDDDDSPDDDDE